MNHSNGLLRWASAKQNTIHYFWGCKLIQPLSILIFNSSKNFNEDILWHTKSLSKKKSHKYCSYVLSKDTDSLSTAYTSKTLNNLQICQQLFSCSVMSDSLWPHGLQHARLPCPSPSPWVCSDSCLSSQWCHPTISSSVVPFSSCFQSVPASGSVPMSWFFILGGQSIGASASAGLWLIYVSAIHWKIIKQVKRIR